MRKKKLYPAPTYFTDPKQKQLVEKAVKHLNEINAKPYVVTRSNFMVEVSLKAAREALLLKPKAKPLANQLPLL